MSMKINHTAKVQGKLVVEGNAIDPTQVTSIYAMFYPANRYPNGIGGQNHRILTLGGILGGKPFYSYGDESVLWNSVNSRWEMFNAYSGVISHSIENVGYPWLVKNWYYGANVLDASVYVEAVV